MEKKVFRFIELSAEFCKAPEDYAKFGNQWTYIGVGTANISSVPSNAPTAIERYEEDKIKLVDTAKRWLEYQELKEALSSYYKAKIKLNE